MISEQQGGTEMRTVTVLLLAGLLVPGLALAGTTGKVAGVVKDRKAGESIPGANVALLGAGGNVVAGAVTDLKGNYTILNVMPGAYAVKCSFIGYRETVVRNVTALVDFTTTVDFAIESEAIQLGQAVEVVATRPLVQKDQTGSVRFASIEDIQNMPLRGYEAVTSLQAGVTDFGGAGLYVRGGAAGRGRLLRGRVLAAGPADRGLPDGDQQQRHRPGEHLRGGGQRGVWAEHVGGGERGDEGGGGEVFRDI
ncbi:MAG: carboxypeptidase-like regulatory domain-containing protein [Candidatus Latescibacteria bacterium]|nr:carboxypeptidase-like regulatory domain-containing protein [Candidatus Latescibacterota bacterium]